MQEPSVQPDSGGLSFQDVNGLVELGLAGLRLLDPNLETPHSVKIMKYKIEMKNIVPRRRV